MSVGSIAFLKALIENNDLIL